MKGYFTENEMSNLSSEAEGVALMNREVLLRITALVLLRINEVVWDKDTVLNHYIY